MKLDKTKVAEYFAAYPDASVLHFTEDGFCFLESHKAASHAKIAGIKYKTVMRSDEDSETELTEEQAKAELLTFELNEDSDWAKLQALGKALNVKARSKVDYIEGLQTIKDELSKSEDEPKDKEEE